MGKYTKWMNCICCKSEGGASTSGALDPSPHPPPVTSVNKSRREELLDVHTVEDLKLLLDYIDEEVSAVPPQQSPGTSSAPQGEASAPPQSSRKNAVPQSITKNIADVEVILDKVTTGCQDVFKAQEGPVGDITNESYKIFVETLHKVGNVHWAAAGFAVVAVVLKRMDLVGANRIQCMDLLLRLRKLGRHLVELYPHFPDDDDKLSEATSLITEGALLCWNHLESNVLKRFLLAGVNEEKLRELKDRIDEWYQGTQLDAANALLRQNSIPLSSSITEYPPNAVGLDEKVSKIMTILGLAERNLIQPGAQAVNLTGIGGIGKSTLAMAVASQAIHAFQTKRCHARVEIGENPTEGKICELQRNILERLSGQRRRTGDWKDGQQILKTYLEKRQDPILLFIDNIFQPQHLQMLLPDQLDKVLSRESRIIITSRPNPMSVSQILDGKGIHDCHEYSVPELEYAQAQELLCMHVFSSAMPPPGKEIVVSSILKRCGGLPLALEVVGQYLRNHRNNDQEWDYAIENLENFLPLDGSNESKLNQALRFSYNQLNPTYQIAFLDIACLLRGIPWDTAKSCKRELENLEKWGLVKRFLVGSHPAEYRSSEVVTVHDLFVALAKSEQQSHSVRVFSENVAEIPFQLQDEDDEMPVEGVVIRDCPVPISAKKLDDMHRSLRILILKDVIVEGRYTKISKKLQVCMVPDIIDQAVTQLKELRVLDIEFDYSEDSSFEIQKLPPCCELVRLANVNSLKVLPQAFPERSSLHSLSLENCHGFRELPTAFCQLQRLGTLELVHCGDLYQLPNGFGRLVTLQLLSLSACKKLAKLPDDFGQLRGLKELYLTGCTGMQRLPSDLVGLDALERLHLEGCEGLHELPPDLGGLTSLKELNLSSCTELKALPLEFGRLCNLEVLNLQECTDLTKLPDDFNLLRSLKVIILDDCTKLQGLPTGFGGLVALEGLHLCGCESLKEIPAEFGGLVSLKVLDLSRCEGLQELPPGFGRLVALEQLMLKGCTHLTRLSEDFGNLTGLERLNLADCTSLQELPNTFGGLVSLEWLDLQGSDNLKELPTDFAGLNSLKVLYLGPRLQEIPSGFGGLVALEYLKFMDCPRLTKLSDDFHQLTSLKRLLLMDCTSFRRLPDGFGELLALEELDLLRCDGLRELPTDFGRLISLNSLFVTSCAGLRELPSGFGGLIALEELTLSGCTGLTKLSNDFHCLTSLKRLDLFGCTSLQGLPNNFGELVALESLNLGRCESVKELPSTFGGLVRLEKLTLGRCEGLKELPSTFGGLVRLEELTLESCTGLLNLPEDFLQLTKLRRVDAKGCRLGNMHLLEELEKRSNCRVSRDDHQAAESSM